MVVRNPCSVKGAATERAAEMRVATVAQVAALAEAINPRFRALVLVAAYAGLRWGELVGLRAKRVDLLHQRITVAEQATEIDGQFTWGPPKTEAGRRTVTLPAVAAAALAEHLSTYSQPGSDGLVFTSTEGGLLRRSNFNNRRVWLPATRAVGLDGLRFHDLRHTSATLSIAAGASTRELMARMGHSSSAAALRYQHVMAGRDAAIAAALDELIEAASALAESPSPAPSGTRVARIGQSASGKKRR
jgi:integrase